MLEFLGIEIDTREGHMCFRLPPHKLVKTLSKIKAFMCDYKSQGVCSAAVLASLIGNLAWCASVVQGGRVFLRSMCHTLAPAFVDAKGQPWTFKGAEDIRLGREFWIDLNWWSFHLVTRNHLKIVSDPMRRLELGSDASD